MANLRQRTSTRFAALVTSGRLPFLAAAVLAAASGAKLATLTWALVSERDPATRVSAAPASPQSSSSGGGPPIARLARLHLFGQQAVAPIPDQAADAPETRLDLTLKGLFVAGGDGLSIIAAGNGDEEIYAVGDTVAGGASVAAILRDRVVVERDGMREILRMEGIDAAPAQPRRTARKHAQERRVETARRLRQRFRAEPASLARTVRFQPARDNGRLIGYRIRSRSSELSLEELGVRPTDVVTRLNGMPLDDPRRANAALASLRDASFVRLGLLRNGQPRTVSIPIGAPS